jgi:hypothetical protein
LGDPTSNTKDSEISFIQAASRLLLSSLSKDKENENKISEEHTKIIINSIHKAFQYITKNIYKPKFGSVIGGDWRDVREDLNDKFVLTNACLFYKTCNDYLQILLKFPAIQSYNIN